MGLDQSEVDAYLQADKRIVGDGPIEWERPAPDCSRWSGTVEVDAVRVGEVWFIANPELPKAWHFTLSLHKTVVYRLENQVPPARHQNRRGCPDGFPGRFGAVPHEHVWIAAVPKLRCARPIKELADGNHHAFFQAFCERAKLVCGPEYSSPLPPFTEMELGS